MHIADAETYSVMESMLARGYAELKRRHEALPEYERPIGTSMDIVMSADFAMHPLLCLRHVVRNRRSLHVICEDGSLCALLEDLSWRAEWASKSKTI